MALSKKKSRLITLENKSFRYIISTGKADVDWNFSLNLTIQDSKGVGNLLKVEGLVTRDFWVDFPNSTKKEDYPVLTPKDISKIITNSIKSGWNPELKGKPYIIKLDNSFINQFAIS
ncbi:hypothetical protein [uncultured Dokdonia sp.]|uniref:hypothetical protein n=1 Tax=uncultured Dokdonia sp. TaxID=575653 RepID=UPI00260F0698|nr:hypothetical protein [uncultured Dokdonia sp.]